MRAAALGLLAAACLAAAPAHAEPRHVAGLGRLSGADVLLLPIDVNAYELARGGANSVRAERTENAREWVRLALDRLLPAERVTLTKYVPPSDAERNERHGEVRNLYAAVRNAMIGHHYNAITYLPSVGDRFAWSLGPGVAVLREDHPGARYALFVEILERYMLGGALVTWGELGSDRLLASASVVDLTTGDVVWTNFERGGSVGSADETTSVVTRLLRDLPF